MHQSDATLRAQLNAETGKITWPELERHFARGVVIRVAGGLDLIEVALRMARDDRPALERWLTEGTVARATPEHAGDWHARDPLLWAVVVAPWVLVQEIEPHRMDA
jgi:hypothetical protein